MTAILGMDIDVVVDIDRLKTIVRPGVEKAVGIFFGRRIEIRIGSRWSTLSGYIDVWAFQSEQSVVMLSDVVQRHR